VAVGHDLVDVAHRRQRDAVLFGDGEHLHLAERARPRRDQRVGLPAIGDARRVVGKPRVVAQILAAHRPEQIVPMLLDRDIHCDDAADLVVLDPFEHAALVRDRQGASADR
jgi:hypothetical protein